MLYLALSCLQGRETQSTAEELFELGTVGLQLTPGNVPTEGFREWLHRRQISTRTHHGFSWRALRRKVWSEKADCLVSADSVHPPQTQTGLTAVWRSKAEQGDYANILLETMYPGYCLGNGDQLCWAMDLGLNLAIDVSHLYLQLSQGCLEVSVWHRLQNYEKVGELHLSANSGRTDTHQPLTRNTFGLEWVRDRAQNGTPVILECYMHRLSVEQRQEQIELAIG
jgi:hypothetical protein